MAAKPPSAQLETAHIDSPAFSPPAREMKWNLLPNGWFRECGCVCVRLVCLFVWPADCMSKRVCILRGRETFPCAIVCFFTVVAWNTQLKHVGGMPFVCFSFLDYMWMCTGFTSTCQQCHCSTLFSRILKAIMIRFSVPGYWILAPQSLWKPLW